MKQAAVPASATPQKESTPFSAKNPAPKSVESPGMGKQRLFKKTATRTTQ